MTAYRVDFSVLVDVDSEDDAVYEAVTNLTDDIEIAEHYVSHIQELSV